MKGVGSDVKRRQIFEAEDKPLSLSSRTIFRVHR